MYRSQNKWCFVPCCTSTSVSTPGKIFVRVPREDYERKKQWFKAARRDMPKSKSEFFCCEDHFNIKEDMENYVRFKLMGGKILMKRDVVPHIFNCQTDRKRTASDVPARSLPMKRERKRLVAEAEAVDEQHFASQPLDTPSTNSKNLEHMEGKIQHAFIQPKLHQEEAKSDSFLKAENSLAAKMDMESETLTTEEYPLDYKNIQDFIKIEEISIDETVLKVIKSEPLELELNSNDNEIMKTIKAEPPVFDSEQEM